MPNFLDRWVIQALTEGAGKIAENARNNASWSKEIPKAIGVGEVRPTSTGYEIVITLDISEESGAPEGAAFEYGSGIHRTKGTKGTYKIRPKNASMLAFQWNPANPIGALMSPKVYDWIEDDNTWLFLEVDHPGVAARPFMRPAILAYKPTFKQKLLVALRNGFRASIGKRIEIIE